MKDPAATPEDDPLAEMGFGDPAPEGGKLAEEPTATEDATKVEDPPASKVSEEPPKAVPEESPTVVSAPPAPSVVEQSVAPAEPATSEGMVTVVVDVPATPGAKKFMDTMSDVGSKVSTLAVDEVSDGMHELARRCTKNMKESFATFKEHSLDLAIVVSRDPPANSSRWKLLKGQAEVTKVAMLPVAAVYAVLAMLCFIAFATIYYPKLYGPKLYEMAKAKFVEYKVAEHATDAAVKLREMSAAAYETAAASELASKVTEKASTAFVAVTEHPTVATVAAKTGEVTSTVRAKLADELVKLRGAPPAEAVVSGSGV